MNVLLVIYVILGLLMALIAYFVARDGRENGPNLAGWVGVVLGGLFWPLVIAFMVGGWWVDRRAAAKSVQRESDNG